MDVRNFEPAAPIFEPRGYMEAANRLGDTVSSVMALNVISPTADFAITEGLVTGFIVTPIPEPRIGVLSLVAVWVVVFSARKRYRATCPGKCMTGNRGQ